MADLWFHTMVLLGGRGISLRRLFEELARRHSSPTRPSGSQVPSPSRPSASQVPSPTRPSGSHPSAKSAPQREGSSS
jgi:hypothetical protein